MGERRYILDLGTAGANGQAASPLGIDCSGSIERAAGWAPEQVQLLWRREKSLAPFGYQIMILQYLVQQNAPSIIIA